MNKDLVQMALIGLTAGVCLSAQASPSPSKDQKEIAMTKCTKTGGEDEGQDSSCKSYRKGSSCSGNGTTDDNSSCSGNTSQSSAPSELENKRKSAAKKVLEGY